VSSAAGTPASECIVAAISQLRVPTFSGAPFRVLKNYAHAPEVGDSRDPPFDEAAARDAAASVRLDECARIPGPRSERVSVEFSPNGTVRSILVGSSWRHQGVNTSLGRCVARAIATVVRPAYSGPRTTIEVDIILPPAHEGTQDALPTTPP
jgi:hypothetical protein